MAQKHSIDKRYVYFFMVVYLKIATINCNGLRDRSKSCLVFDFLRKSCVDVVLLQETYSTLDVEFLWSSEWRRNSIWNSGTNNARGVAILISNNYLY